METWIIDNETVIRLSFFFGIFILVAIWELLAPRRTLNFSKAVRWYSNIGVVFFNSLVMRFTFPVLATGLAVLAQEGSWGFINNVTI